MYFPKVESKQEEKYIEYNLAKGIEKIKKINNCEIIAQKNMSSRNYPFLSTRNKYFEKQDTNTYTGMGIATDSFYYTKQQGFYFDDILQDSVDTSRKSFSFFGKKILIFPDKLSYNIQSGMTENLYKGTGEIEYSILRGELDGEDAGFNTIYSMDVDLTDIFGVGYGVRLYNSNKNDVFGYAVVRAVDTEHQYLICDKNSFNLSSTVLLTGTVSNGFPADCTVSCTYDGRAWVGYRSKIYASAYSDITNWSKYELREDSSFLIDSEDLEDFTYCATIDGSPMFFTKNKIYKIYGDSPRNYTLKCVHDGQGMASEHTNSATFVGEELFYLSGYNVVRFSGGEPEVVENFPGVNIASAICGADRNCYYMSAVDVNDEEYFYVYDKRYDQWYEYESQNIEFFIGNLDYNCYVKAQGKIIAIGNHARQPIGYSLEEDFTSFVEFDEFYVNKNFMYPKTLKTIVEKDESCNIDVFVKVDDEEDWLCVGEISGDCNGLHEIQLNIKPCKSIKIKIVADGEYTLKMLKLNYTEI